jgi:hypothetical protein
VTDYTVTGLTVTFIGHGLGLVRDLDTREDEGGCQGGVETDSWASCG